MQCTGVHCILAACTRCNKLTGINPELTSKTRQFPNKTRQFPINKTRQFPIELSSTSYRINVNFL